MTLFKMENRRNFGFSAENPTGTKGGGTRAKDRPWKHRFRHFSVARMTRIFLTATAITRF